MKAGRHLSLLSAKKLLSMGSSRRKEKKRKHQGNDCFWFQTRNMYTHTHTHTHTHTYTHTHTHLHAYVQGSTKNSSWSARGTLPFLESRNEK